MRFAQIDVSHIVEKHKNKQAYQTAGLKGYIMTDLKFSILKKLYKAKDNRWDQNELISKYRKKLTKTRHAIEDFIEHHYIEKLNDQEIRLTRRGEELYEEEYDRRKQNRHNFTIALISVIAASIAALVPFIEFILSRF